MGQGKNRETSQADSSPERPRGWATKREAGRVSDFFFGCRHNKHPPSVAFYQNPPPHCIITWSLSSQRGVRWFPEEKVACSRLFCLSCHQFLCCWHFSSEEERRFGRSFYKQMSRVPTRSISFCGQRLVKGNTGSILYGAWPPQGQKS